MVYLWPSSPSTADLFPPLFLSPFLLVSQTKKNSRFPCVSRYLLSGRQPVVAVIVFLCQGLSFFTASFKRTARLSLSLFSSRVSDSPASRERYPTSIIHRLISWLLDNTLSFQASPPAAGHRSFLLATRKPDTYQVPIVLFWHQLHSHIKMHTLSTWAAALYILSTVQPAEAGPLAWAGKVRRAEAGSHNSLTNTTASAPSSV